MRSKPFFYACAGLFLLALGYHVGARNAGATSGSGIDCASIEDNGNTVVAMDRQLWSHPGQPVWLNTVPGASLIIACGGRVDAGWVLLADGERWACSRTDTGQGAWHLVEQWRVGATTAHQQSLGSVKLRYR
jgi:hypothetical protein